MTAKEMLSAAGYSDTPEGRAAFYERYPSEESFMQDQNMQMRMGGKMPCMSCGGSKKYAQGGILDQRHYRDAAFNHIANQTPVFVRAYQDGGASQEDQIMQVIQAYAQMAQMNPEDLIQQLQQMPQEEQQQAIEQMMAALQQGQQSAQEEQAEGPMSNPQEEMMEEGEVGMRRGGIKLDPAKRGTFKAQASRMGMSMSAAADKILNAPEGQYSPAMRRKANFYKNFAKAYGGSMQEYQMAGQTNQTASPAFRYATPKTAKELAFSNMAAQTSPTYGQQPEVMKALGIKTEEQKYKEEHPYKFDVLNKLPYAKEFASGMEAIMPAIEFGLHGASVAPLGAVGLTDEGAFLKTLIPKLEHGIKHELASKVAHSVDGHVGSNVAQSSFKRNGGYFNRYQEGGNSQDQVMQIIQAYAEVAQMKPEEIISQLQSLSEEEQQKAIQQMAVDLQNMQGQPEEGEFEMELPQEQVGEGQEEEEEAPMTEQEMEHMKYGGIPERYRKQGFTRVGVKRQSTRPGKKWMVLAKKGDKYKIIHGGYKGMQDFKQHHSSQRRENFWNRMGGKDSAKAKDPFSPLYWHKRFGTWAEGGMIPKYQNAGTSDDFSNYGQMNPTGPRPELAPNVSDPSQWNTMNFGSDYMHNPPQKEFVSVSTPDIPATLPTIPQSQLDNAQKQAAARDAQYETKYKTKWNPSINLAPGKQKTLKDLNYDLDTNSGKLNTAAVMATNLSNPNSMLWALPNKGISGALKAAAGIASGLSGSYLGYAKAFGNRETDYLSKPMRVKKNMEQPEGSGQEALDQVKAAQEAGKGTSYFPTNKMYGGMNKYQFGGGSAPLSYEDWKTKNAKDLEGITDETMLQKLYDNYKKNFKSPDQIAAKNAYMGFAMANTALSGMSSDNQYQKHQQETGNTDSRFPEYNPTNPYGTYTPNAGIASNFGLVANTPIQDFGTTMAAAAYGGEYQEGGVYELTDDEIQDIIRRGGSVQYV